MRVVGLFCLLLLSACASGPSEAEALRQIGRVTEVTYLGNDRLKLTTEKPFLLGVEGLEYALLARAAEETKARGGVSFAIVRADYHQRGALFGDESLMPLGRTWIGSYEDLLAHRERETARPGKITGVSWIVVMQPADEVPLRRTFSADETYGALVDAWIEERLR